MKLATKAALFSALLFPGWGQLYLKKYKRGIFFILLVLVGILSICFSVVQVAINVLKAAPVHKDAVNFGTVIKLATDSLKALDVSYLSLISLGIILLWVLSIVDAYLLGKKQMQEPILSVNQQ